MDMTDSNTNRKSHVTESPTSKLINYLCVTQSVIHSLLRRQIDNAKIMHNFTNNPA